jgi:deoxyribodipyrimidine photo-lyase
MAPPSIVWLRQDLRLHDQPALSAAAAEGAVLPIYILDDVTPGRWAIGGAQRVAAPQLGWAIAQFVA